MKKRPSQISSLLAARPAALRRPPAGSSSPVANLRLARDEESDPSASSCSQSLETARLNKDSAATDPALMIRTATTSIAGIYALLGELMDRFNVPGRSHRRSPREVAELQAHTDRTLLEMDRIVEAAEFNGVKLLTGYWSASPARRTDAASRRIPVDSMQTSRLGPDADRTLASMRTGGAHSLLIRGVDEALRILQHAALQVAQCRRRLAELDTAQATPQIDDEGVVRENAAAANAACDDLDFTELTSRLTPGDCLARSHASKARPALRPVREQPGAASFDSE